MKKIQRSKTPPVETDDMKDEYDFDYSKARPNRFAAIIGDRTAVLLDVDVAKVFTTTESVNHALRAIINAMPRPKTKRAKSRRATVRRDISESAAK